MIEKSDRILIVAAHPDDESLGCGGTIHKFSKQYGGKLPIYSLILSEGLTSRGGEFNKSELEQVIKDSMTAAGILGITKSFYENLPNNRLDSMDLLDVIKIVEKYVAEIKPTVVFTHHHGDINIAHRITYQAVLTACRPVGKFPVKKLISCEVTSSTEWAFPNYKNAFSPNLFFELNADSVQAKIDAMEAYQSERRAAPHPRSSEMVKANAMRWGSVVHAHYAEAFELIYGTYHN